MFEVGVRALRGLPGIVLRTALARRCWDSPGALWPSGKIERVSERRPWRLATSLRYGFGRILKIDIATYRIVLIATKVDSTANQRAPRIDSGSTVART